MNISLDQVLGVSQDREPVQWADRSRRTAPASRTAQPVQLPEGSMLPSDPEVRQVLTETAERYKINPALLMAMAHQESAYNAEAVGPQTKWGTAKGMFQFLDTTARNLGIDPLDWKQAADAAARDLAEQTARNGTDWAVAHHHAGPNPKQHGPKTAQYTQSVLAKANAIARELGIDFQMPESARADFSNVTGGAGVGKVSLDAVLSAEQVPSQGTEDTPETPEGPESFRTTANRVIAEAAPNTPPGMNPAAELITGAIQRTVERGWEGIQNALNRDTEIVERTDDELRRLWETEGSRSRAVTEYGMTYEQWADRNREVRVSTKPFAEEEAEWAQRLEERPEDAYLLPKRLSHLRPQADDSRFAPANTFQGIAQRFISNAKNPFDLFLQDSIPADIVTALFTLPELERKKFDQARQVSQALEISNNPDGRSPEEIEMADAIIADWRSRTNQTIADAWSEMWQAAKEDPSGVGVGLYEAIAADPYMAAAPMGTGVIKPMRAINAARVAARGVPRSNIARRAETIIDRFADAGTLAASLNVAAGAADNLSMEGRINDPEVKLNAAMGYFLGGPPGVIFMRGARARAKGLDRARLDGTLEDTIRDIAKAEHEMEVRATEAVREPTDAEYRTVESALNQEQSRRRALANERIRQLLGVRTEEEVKAWKKQRRAEVKEWFKNNEEYADYQRYLAEERMARADVLSEAAEARQRSAAEAAEAASLEAEARKARWQEEFDAAIAARNAARESDMIEAARAEDAAWEAAQKLNAEELFEAEFTGDHPTIKQVEAKIKRRNDQLGRTKRQSGEASPEMLTRLGLATGGAAAAAYAFPEDQKLQGAFLGGLAGLLVPGVGGSVLSRMRQAGAISSDGDIISALVRRGKMANKLEESEIKARDDAWVDAAKQGDQSALENIYREYFGPVSRSVQKFVNRRESQLAAGAEDIAQEAFLDVFKAIQDPNFQLETGLPQLLYKAAENRALKTLRARNTVKRGGAEEVQESQYFNEDMYEGDRGSSRSIMDETTGVDDYSGETIIDNVKETPEIAAIRDDMLDIIRQELESMPEQPRRLFTMVHLEHYTPEDAAKHLGLKRETVWKALQRAEARIKNALDENRRKLGEPVTKEMIRGPRNQRGSATVDDMRGLAAIATTAAAAGTAGYFFTDGDLWKTAVFTTLATPAAMMLGGKFRGGTGNVIKGDLRGTNRLAASIRSIDHRLRDMGEELFGRAKKHGEQELRHIKNYNDATADFINTFSKLPKDIKPVVVKALSTRDKRVIDKILTETGGSEFVRAFDKVRKVLDELEDQLVGYGLIKKSEKDYFPFRVKDLEGLKKKLGQEASTEIDAAIAKAEAKMQKDQQRPLTEIEKSIVINKVLEPYLGKPISAHTPGFAKARTIQVIDETLQPFYHDPVATLNSYGVQAIKYIERAKFFGRHLKKTKNSEGNYAVNIGDSIGELVNDLRTRGKIDDRQAVELAGMLQDRFNGGEMASSHLIQGTKNLTNAALLGHVASAIVQLGDIAIQASRQGFIPSVKALRRQLTRDKLVDLKNYGMTEHIAHEFLSDGWTRRVADWSFKWGGFRAIDHIGKNFGLNAAIEKMFKDARTPQGILRLSDKFQRAFPDDFDKALAALKKGQVNESVELLAFSELTRTQPVTAWELPQMYHRMPNGRVVYHLQTFSLRVLNMVHEEALKDIMSKSPKRIAKGVKNLLTIGTVLGVQGVAADKLKDFVAGKPIELSWTEIPLNALEALGMNMYDYNRMADKGPIAGIAEGKLPPILRMSQQVWEDPERSVRFIPVAGRALYDRNREAFEQRRRERRKREGYKMEITVPPSEDSGSRRSSRRSDGRRSTRRDDRRR